ncbi:MAG: hypothetical protein HDT47_08140 [Ruminococcaceae bacterium]|nr:hypothetical protein [Oscillospiraceae bacterium]
MKNIIKASLSLFSVIALLTACSGNSDTNPVIGTVAENEIPSEPVLFKPEISANLENVKSNAPVKSFMGINGEELSVSFAVNVIEPNPERQSNYAFIYDHAYITYNTPWYERDSLNSEKYLDSSDWVEKYNEYLQNKSNYYIVKRGDKLKNGLICTDAETTYYYNHDGHISLLNTEVCLSGELTLTGTVYSLQDEETVVITGKGDLTFWPDADNGIIPNSYEMFLSEKVDIDSTPVIYESFYLGNISDLSEEYASLINENEYTDIQVTLKDIHLRFANDGTIRGSSAKVVDMKVI